MADRHVADLAAAVIDGEVIDWRAAQSQFASPYQRSVAAQLQTLSQLDTWAETVAVPRRTRNLPLLLEAIRLMTIVATVVGLAGEVGALYRVASPRLAVILATGLVFAATAALLDVGSRERRGRALAFCYWTIAAAFSTSGIRWLAELYPSMALQLLGAVHADAFFAACLWQFARDFPMLSRFGFVDRLCTVAGRVTLGIGVILFVANVAPVLAPQAMAADWFTSVQRMSGYGPWFWNLTFGGSLPALIVIAWRGRSATGQEALRVRLFLYGFAASILPVTTEVIAEGLFPRFGSLMQTPTGRLWGGAVIYTTMLALPVLTAYAVAVDNVLEVRVVIRRAVRYLLARWLVMWGAVIPVALLMIHLYRHSSRPLSEIVTDPVASALLWLAGAALVVLLFRRNLLLALDRWVLPGIEDPSVILAQLTEGLKQSRTPLEVATTVARAVERGLQAPADAYLSRDGALLPVHRGAVPLAVPSLVRVLLEGSAEPCVVSERHGQSYFPLLSERDRAWILDRDVAVLIPIVAGRTGTLLAMVALKHRRNALGFASEDLRFLRAATAAASLACDLVQSSAQIAAADSPDEFGIECRRCGRVENWESSSRPCACGEAQWHPAVLPKQLLGRFEVTHKLGAGGMGVVYAATDVRLGRSVAIKTLTRLTDQAAHRLMLEARTMADVAHPSIAVLYGTETWRGTPLLIMEHMAGGTLAAKLARGAMTPATAIGLLTPLAAALEHVHETGRYHGDIKPSNIGFTSDGAPKFLDFGLSRAITGRPEDGPYGMHSQDDARPIAGTWAYLSPEVRDGEAPGPALDVWALSLVFCEAVLGKHPFIVSTRPLAVRRNTILNATDLPASLPEAMRTFLRRALAAVPSRYPRTAAEMSTELERLRKDASL